MRAACRLILSPKRLDPKIALHVDHVPKGTGYKFLRNGQYGMAKSEKPIGNGQQGTPSYTNMYYCCLFLDMYIYIYINV